MAKSNSPGKIIDIPRIEDPRGSLSFVQEPGASPFPVERVYWIYDVPAESVRNGRALANTHELIISISGAFTVTLDDGCGNVERYRLDRCYKGLLVPAGTWRVIDDFVTNSVAVVLASQPYSESEYIRNYDDFLKCKEGIT